MGHPRVAEDRVWAVGVSPTQGAGLQGLNTGVGGHWSPPQRLCRMGLFHGVRDQTEIPSGNSVYRSSASEGWGASLGGGGECPRPELADPAGPQASLRFTAVSELHVGKTWLSEPVAW